MGTMIPYRGYNNGYDNLMYNMHKNASVRYTQECVMYGKIQ